MYTIDFAIKMEYDGEKYYSEMAENNRDSELYTVCRIMAGEERNHAHILENKKNHSSYQLPASDLTAAAQNIFTGAKGIAVKGTNYPTQLGFYNIVCEKEQESIDLYEALLSEAVQEEDRRLFQYLINQEKQHLETFEEMSRLLQNAEWWVESPEFGLRREEY